MAFVPDLRVDESALRWDPAEVTVPSVPPVFGVADPMSWLVATVMPKVAAKVTEMVAATRAREVEFAENIEAAKRAYRGADDEGEQDLRRAEQRVDPLVGPVGSSLAGTAGTASGLSGGSALSQLLSTPMQLAGAVAAVPQGVVQGLQGVGEQAGQVAGMVGEAVSGHPSADTAAATENLQPESEDEPTDYADEVAIDHEAVTEPGDRDKDPEPGARAGGPADPAPMQARSGRTSSETMM